MKRAVAIALFVLGVPFVVAWSFVARLVHGIVEAWRDACREVRIEAASFRPEWERIIEDTKGDSHG
jgi:hypothetical protein